MFIFKKILYFLYCKLLFKVKFVNNNLEKNIEKCIICPNHVGFEDGIIIYSNTKNLAVMAKAELFKNWVLKWILLKLNVFPINRQEKDAKSILHAVNILKNNKADKLLVFPEGTRVKQGERLPAKIGAVYIAMKTNLPILPVRIIKEHPNRKFFSKIVVIYDNPIYLDKSKIKDKLYLKDVSDSLMDNIYNIKSE